MTGGCGLHHTLSVFLGWLELEVETSWQIRCVEVGPSL